MTTSSESASLLFAAGARLKRSRHLAACDAWGQIRGAMGGGLGAMYVLGQKDYFPRRLYWWTCACGGKRPRGGG